MGNKKKIFESSLLPVVLYTGEIWALKHLDVIENIPEMYKAVYNWQTSSALLNPEGIRCPLLRCQRLKNSSQPDAENPSNRK